MAKKLRTLAIECATAATPAEVSITGSEEAINHLVSEAEQGWMTMGSNPLLGIRTGTEWLFEAVPHFPKPVIDLHDVGPDELRSLLQKIDVLVMTATETETDAVLSVLQRLPGQPALAAGALNIDTYTLGVFGRYAVAHCQSGMGSSSADGSQLTTSDAIRDVMPKIILLLGIAFGTRRSEQRIGDVLVAKHIRPYDMYKLKPETIEERGSSIRGSVKLVKWMQDRTRDWRMPRADHSYVRLISPGDILSGEKLVNNRPFRDWLMYRFPTAIGGEMEGLGAYSANQRYGTSEILLVKAICDWADGCKNDRAQPFAAAAAVSAVFHLLNKPDALSPLGITMAS